MQYAGNGSIHEPAYQQWADVRGRISFHRGRHRMFSERAALKLTDLANDLIDFLQSSDLVFMRHSFVRQTTTVTTKTSSPREVHSVLRYDDPLPHTRRGESDVPQL